MRKHWGERALICSTLLLLLVACAGTVSGTPTSTRSGTIVSMNSTQFVPSLITIHKGESIPLIADTAVPHIIENGTWEQSMPKKRKESGAPLVHGVQIAGGGKGIIGPFNISGTFHFYCTIHTNMNLTVIVQ